MSSFFFLHRKEVLGGIGVCITLYSYVPYIRDIVCRKTKPHLYSRLIWAIMLGIVTVGQMQSGSGVGVLPTLITCVISTIIAGLCIKYGTTHIANIDQICLVGVVIALVCWFISDNVLVSVLIATLIDVIAYIPTFLKSYGAPYEETMITHSLSGIKYTISAITMSHYSLINLIYPVSVIILEFGLYVFLCVRRRQIASS